MKHAPQVILAVGFATLLTMTWLLLVGFPRRDSLPSLLQRAGERAALLDQWLPQPLREAFNSATLPTASPLPSDTPSIEVSSDGLAQPTATVYPAKPGGMGPPAGLSPTGSPTAVPPAPTATSSPSIATETAAPPTAPPVSRSTDGIYAVQAGDNLAAIAARFGTTTNAVLAANGLSRDEFIWLGQKLIIPPPDGHATGLPGVGLAGSKVLAVSLDAETPASQPTGAPGPALLAAAGAGQTQIYVIQPGDRLSDIANKFGTSVQVIAATNGITNPSIIWVGKKLTIPVAGATSATPQGGQATPAARITPITAPTGRSPAGKVVFQTASGKEIFVINADGSGLKYLTQGMDPALSPDGRWVAFIRWGDQPGIYNIMVDGSQEKLVYRVTQARQPAWSPDGSRLAFSYQHGDRTTETHDKDGKAHRFTDLFWRVAMVGADGAGFTEFPCKDHSSAPTWSADGKRVAFAGNEGITVSGLDGFYQELTHGPWHLTPAWSPDGGRIAFAMKRADHFDLFVMSNVGAGLTTLTTPPLYTDRPVNNVSPSWSPDGSHIVFLSDRNERWEIFSMNADGSDQRQMFDGGLAGVQLAYDFVSEKAVSWGP